MKFVHEDSEFVDLLSIVAGERHIATALIEKDYWVTHVLWALYQTDLVLWFKGGTSLSKGFALIQRFSEDVDLHIAPGSASNVPNVRNWKAAGKVAKEERKEFYQALETYILIPDCTLRLDRGVWDEEAHSAAYRVEYPGHFLGELSAVMRPFVMLEVGHAKVFPSVPRPLSSFVHDHLSASGNLAQFRDNRPAAVRCVHPLVTLLEKLDAITRRYNREPFEPASFVRHYEDAARIIEATPRLPELDKPPGDLVGDILSDQRAALIRDLNNDAFSLSVGARGREVHRAYEDIESMFWGPRRSLVEVCGVIRVWVEKELAFPR